MTVSPAANDFAAQLVEQADTLPFSTEAILGPAGSGKSTELKNRSDADPNYCKLCATTGIAAINLGPGVTTVNSVLGFYNEESAWDALESGRLRARFRDLADAGYRNLVIDEVSMMPAGTLTAITMGAAQAADAVQAMNASKGRSVQPCGVILTGDFLQLSPIKAPYAFTSPVWPLYDRAITKLEKIYRQSDPAFLEALSAARAGRGTTATMKLNAAGVKFVAERNDFFDGTSLVPTNDMADKINAVRYAAIESDDDDAEQVYKSVRWGKEGSEWKDIPAELRMKKGAFVMVLANKPQTFDYVNGDQGNVLDLGENTITVGIRRGVEPNAVVKTETIEYVWRETVQKDKPEGASEYSGFLCAGYRFEHPDEIDKHFRGDDSPESVVMRGQAFAAFFRQYDAYCDDAIKRRIPFYSATKKRWVIGWIEYMPIRLAYASTIHKTQGLTLDRIQIDARNRFAGNPGMMYVALSRCRTPGNIRIVANQADFAKRIQTAKECLRWV